MTAQWYADAERNLRKTVGLALKPIKANYQLGLLLTKAFALALILVLASAGPAAAQQTEKPAPSVGQLEAAVKRRPSDPKLHVALGLAYWERNDYPRALMAFQRAVKVAPRSAEAHNWLGVALSEKSDLPGAIAELRKAVALDPKYGRAYTNLGSVLAKSGDFTEAVAVFQKALTLEPNSLAAHLNLGMALRDKGDLDAALEHLRPVAAADPTNASIQYELGQTLRQRGDLTDAVGAFEKALEIEPELREAYYALGMALKQQSASLRKPSSSANSPADDLYKRGRDSAARGELNAAREALAEALRLDDNHAGAHNLLGFILGQQGDLPAALAHLERAVALQRESAEAHYNLGVALWYSGSKERAVSELQESVRLDPAAGASDAFLGTALREKGEFAAARASLQRAIALLPPTAAVYVDLGITYLRAGEPDKALGQLEAGLNLPSPSVPRPDWDSAIAGLRQALAAKPVRTDNAPDARTPEQWAGEAHNVLGRLLGRSGADSSQVAAEFREAIRLRPDFAEAHNQLGLVLIQSGDDDGGIAALREAVRISPDYADAHDNLGAALTPTNVKEAIGELEKAVALAPTSAKAQFNLAVAYGASSSLGPAKEVEQLRKVIALAPTFARAHLALGKALLQDGKVTDAVTALEEAARLEPQSGESHYQLGLALARAGRADEAAAQLKKGRDLVAAADRDQNANLDIAEGRAALEKGDLEQAAARFRHAIQLRPDSSDAQRYLAVVQEKQADAGKDDPARVAELEGYIRHGKFKEVEALLGEYVKERPKSSWGWYALGYSLFAQQKIGDSINALAKSLELDIRNAEAHKTLGRNLMIIGRFDAAQVEFEQGLRYKPDSAEIHYNLGKLFSIQDNWEPAKEAVRSGVAHRPVLPRSDGWARVRARGSRRRPRRAGRIPEGDRAERRAQGHVRLSSRQHERLLQPHGRSGKGRRVRRQGARARSAVRSRLVPERPCLRASRETGRGGHGARPRHLDQPARVVLLLRPRRVSTAGWAGAADSQKALETFKRLEREASELE